MEAMSTNSRLDMNFCGQSGIVGGEVGQKPCQYIAKRT
jgi:hypothetical protein